jgi:hypothetical protein
VPPGDVSSSCDDEEGAHDLCDHVRGVGANLWSRDRFVTQVTLCPCACHDACPLAGTKQVPESEWDERCACPAAAEAKIEVAARRERSRDEKERKALAFQEALAESEGVADAELEGVVRAAYQRHGLEADDHQLGLLADVIRTSRLSPAVQPFQMVRLFGKAFAPVVRVIGDAMRAERRRRRRREPPAE